MLVYDINVLQEVLTNPKNSNKKIKWENLMFKNFDYKYECVLKCLLENKSDFRDTTKINFQGNPLNIRDKTINQLFLT